MIWDIQWGEKRTQADCLNNKNDKRVILKLLTTLNE